MAKTKVLITVKTYPTPSTSYDELVCTAGFTEDGKWIRIYPIPFRQLDYVHQYSKYDWVEIDLVKNTKDFRPESYRPANIDVDEPIKKVGEIDTKNNWAARKKLVLGKVYTNMEELIAEAKNKEIGTSLAVFKPTEIIDFVYEEVEREWSKKFLEQLKQSKLFEQEKEFNVVRKLPYKFSYVFKSEDGKKRTLMIEDWETGALFWNGMKRFDGDEAQACEYVRSKYYNDFAKTKDLYFFLGTFFKHHLKNAPNPFGIIGTFHPKPENQLSLDI